MSDQPEAQRNQPQGYHEAEQITYVEMHDTDGLEGQQQADNDQD